MYSWLEVFITYQTAFFYFVFFLEIFICRVFCMYSYSLFYSVNNTVTIFRVDNLKKLLMEKTQVEI